MLVSSSSDSPPMKAALEKLRCCRCGRTIAKVTAGDLLRSGAMIEIKCGACNGFSYLIGTEQLTTS